MLQRPSHVSHIQRPKDINRLHHRVRREAQRARDQATAAQQLANNAELAALELEESEDSDYSPSATTESTNSTMAEQVNNQKTLNDYAVESEERLREPKIKPQKPNS